MIMQQIKDKLVLRNKHELAHEMGYSNKNIFEQTLEEFLWYQNHYLWVSNGHYDLVNSSKDFFLKLTKALEIDEVEVRKALNDAEAYRVEVNRFKKAYIFVNTNFKRKSEPIFALAFMEHKRRIDLSTHKELFFHSEDEILKRISVIVKEHFEANKEGLSLWGKIVNYQMHLFGEVYVFDANGLLSENKEPSLESLATMHI